MDEGHQKLRDAALRRYYDDPAICKNCKEVIEVKIGGKPSEAKRKKYCSRSCSISVSNATRKREGNSPICPDCGGRKDYEAVRCVGCWKRKRLRDAEKRPICELFLKGNARIKYSYIRKLALRAVNLWGIPRKCEKCEGREFDSVAEIHHIRGISDFEDDVLLGEVNARENMRYLCPSHHALEDLK